LNEEKKENKEKNGINIDGAAWFRLNRNDVGEKVATKRAWILQWPSLYCIDGFTLMLFGSFIIKGISLKDQ